MESIGYGLCPSSFITLLDSTMVPGSPRGRLIDIACDITWRLMARHQVMTLTTGCLTITAISSAGVSRKEDKDERSI